MSQSNATAAAAATAGFFSKVEIQSAGENGSGEEQQDSQIEEPATQEDDPELGETEDLQEENPEEEVPDAESNEDTDPDDPDKKRFRYWQSKHDKAQAELAQLKKQSEEFAKIPKQAIDLAATLLESPDIVEVVEAYLKTGQKPGQVQKGNSAQEQLSSLQRPAAPQRPVDYDEEEAMVDPRSESAKYRKAYDQYRDSLQDYLVKRDELRDLVEQEKSAQATQQKRMVDQQQQINRELMSKHGLTATEVDEFHKVHSGQISLEDAVAFYRLKSGKLKTVVQAAQRASEADKKVALKAKNPPAPVKGAGTTKQTKTSFFGR